MKAISIVCIITAGLGLFFSFCMMMATTADVDTMIGYGFLGFLANGLFLALAIVSINRK